MLTQTADRAHSRIPLEVQEQPVTRETLVAVVLEAVKQVDWTQPTPEGRVGRIKTARAESILTILTYCYAAGIYGTQEIEREISRRQVGQNLMNSYQLDGASFRMFRRHNRDLIKQCLVEVFSRLRETALDPTGEGATGWTSTRSLERGLPCAARLSPGFETAAEHRLQRAIQWDTMAMDN
jgi:hypothetical protein